MKKKIMLLVAVAMMLVVTVSPVMAKGGGSAGVIGEPPGWSNVPGFGGAGNGN